MAWLIFALRFSGAPNWTLAVVLAAALALLAAGVLRIRAERKSGAPGRSRAARIGFLVVLALEGAAIGTAAALLPRWGMETHIPAAISAILGLHFLPLAQIFRTPIYYATGLALIVATALAVALAQGPQEGVMIGFAAGAVLWLTSLARALGG